MDVTVEDVSQIFELPYKGCPIELNIGDNRTTQTSSKGILKEGP